MGSVGRYVYRSVLAAFAIVRVGVKLLRWLTTEWVRACALVLLPWRAVFVLAGIEGLPTRRPTERISSGPAAIGEGLANAAVQ